MQNTIKQRFDLQYMAHMMNMTYRSKQQVTRELKGSSHTLAILMSMLRVCLEYAWSMPGVCLRYAYATPTSSRLTLNELTARCQRDYGSSLTRLRLMPDEITARHVPAPDTHSRKQQCVGTNQFFGNLFYGYARYWIL